MYYSKLFGTTIGQISRPSWSMKKDAVHRFVSSCDKCWMVMTFHNSWLIFFCSLVHLIIHYKCACCHMQQQPTRELLPFQEVVAWWPHSGRIITPYWSVCPFRIFPWLASSTPSYLSGQILFSKLYCKQRIWKKSCQFSTNCCYRIAKSSFFLPEMRISTHFLKRVESKTRKGWTFLISESFIHRLEADVIERTP